GRTGRLHPVDRELAATRRLLGHQLHGRLLRRLGAAAIGGALVLGAHGDGIGLLLATIVLTLGEYDERRLFFLASVTPRMPGSPR
ncbi:MAG: hypothetical protein JWO77_1712, partial [Ilumatobacteraceae bacterium]|nr:hypothetical protein [Ilumatobacteraceae bacterium]